MDEPTVLKVQMPTQVFLNATTKDLGKEVGILPSSLIRTSQPQLIPLTDSQDFYSLQRVYSIIAVPLKNHLAHFFNRLFIKPFILKTGFDFCKTSGI